MADSFIQASSSDQQADVCAKERAKEDTVKQVVHHFYGKVRQDRLLGPVFDRFIGNEWDTHLARMCDFWSAILFQTGRYKGNPMLAHLQIEEISPRHFDRWVELFIETVGEQCDPTLGDRFIGLALRMRENLQGAVVQARGNAA
jgi:hemoglobin